MGEHASREKRLDAVVRSTVAAVASPKVTVVLLAMAMFIVLAGTFAQADKDVWQVVDEYFRIRFDSWRSLLATSFAYIELSVFFPRSFFPSGLTLPGAIYFPSGWLIGFGMALNLAAAFATRFVPVAKGKRRRWGFALMAIGLALGWWIVASDIAGAYEPTDPALRVVWALGKGTLAGGLLLWGCVMLHKKRAGLVLLHLGIALLMLGELFVGTSAEEGVMFIREGETVSFTEDTRDLELALQAAAAGSVAIDGFTLRQSFERGEPIDTPLGELSLSIAVRSYHRHAKLKKVDGAWRPFAAPTGNDGQRAAVELTVGGQPVMPSQEAFTSMDGDLLRFDSAKVFIDGSEVEVVLRRRRRAKPYSVTLLDVRKVDYPGTNIPEDYSSFVRVTDGDGVDREVRIWMNNPLRFSGDTLYQSGYHNTPGGEATTLQVVSNESRMLPYIGCMVVALGMLAHFWLVLMRFVRRRRKKSAREATTDESKPARGGRIPLVIAAATVVWLGMAYNRAATQSDTSTVDRFGELAVQYQGRIKPLDSLARNSLRIVSDRYSYKDAAGDEQPAMRWFLDILARPDRGFSHRTIRIENDRVIELMGLQRRDGLRYAIDELRPNLQALSKEARRAASKDDATLDTFDRKVLELQRKLGLIEMLIQAFTPPRIRHEHVKEDVQLAAQKIGELKQRNAPRLIAAATASEPWSLYPEAWIKRTMLETGPSSVITYSRAFHAYSQGDEPAFAEHTAALAGSANDRTRFEAHFNRFQPYSKSAALYLLAFIVSALAWLIPSGRIAASLRRSASAVIAITFIVHTLALVARMYIHGRPMVTNLYSSAIFIGWAGVLMGLILERMNKTGVGNGVAAVSGYVTLIIAHNLAGDGDTLAVMQAVLDTNFWLATHVTCITLGYATTFVAGLLGIIYVLAGLLTPWLRRHGETVQRMIYGVICFAILFSFVGTVLGGLWADDSWGRFWGWDPKENGALLVVLWNALVLHARWAKIAKARGVALLAIAGNIIVAWSWFGVNELGIGLHSYGFTEGVLHKLGIFIASQLAIIAIGAIPLTMWRSRRTPSPVSGAASS